ncbi:MAG: RagB/SusD family nutrient uptake outer membrane protein [Chryseobacterium sp.]|nr:MAG: RagB/SusD family nutrient uptake outer membrane protein [Chryseobacterium sp.]
MKKVFQIQFWSLLLIALFTVSSCTDDLDVLPTDDDANTLEEYLTNNPDGYKNYLGKLYSGLAVSGPNGAGSSDIQGLDNGFGQYLRAYWMMQEVPTDEAILGWVNDQGVLPMSAGTWSTDNQFIRAMYLRIVYQARINSEYLAQTTTDKLNARGVSATLQSEITTYRAEARFLRALSYYHGIDLFGKMTYIDENSPVGFFYPEEKSRAELFSYVESELLAIEPQMVAARANEYGRADRAAVWMLLAKLYLNAEVYTGTARWTDALTYSKKVIDAGYTLNGNYANVFKADNNTNGAQNEVIFPVLSDGNHLQSYGSTTFIIHAATGGSMVTADRGIDFGWGGLRTRRELVTKFPSSDPRGMFHTSGQSLDIAAIGPEFTQGYAVNKFSNKTSTGGNGANPTFVDTDFPLFRLADAYLMYAEAHLRGGGGSITDATTYVLNLRTRSGASPITAGDLNLNFILDERARELYWEGHRRQDLIRFNKFVGNYNWQWKNNSLSGSNMQNHFNLYPIPAQSRLANPNLTQNPDY